MILSKILQLKMSQAFFKTYRFDNEKIDYLIRKFDNKTKLGYLQMIGSTKDPELRINNDEFIKEIEKFSNFIKTDSIRRDPSLSREILNHKGTMKQVETWSNHPRLKGEYDHVRSGMKKIAFFAVPKITIKEINDRFAKEGIEPLGDFEGEIENKKTGKSMFIVKQGLIDE